MNSVCFPEGFQSSYMNVIVVVDEMGAHAAFQFKMEESITIASVLHVWVSFEVDHISF